MRLFSQLMNKITQRTRKTVVVDGILFFQGPTRRTWKDLTEWTRILCPFAKTIVVIEE